MKSIDLYKILRDNNFKLSTDSRKITGGEVFFAIKGDNFDGNSFAGEALKKGAEIAVIDDPSCKREGAYLVSDVMKALQSVAAEHRKHLDIPVMAVTGSNGKTTTKELMARVLAKDYNVHYTRGNLNNHIGVPLTILSAPEEVQFMIVEMGASHKGEIRDLCEIAQPGYGLITNIGKAHLEGFGSLGSVIEAKSEMYDYIAAKGGSVFYNDDNSILTDLVTGRDINAIPYSKPGKHEVEVRQVRQNPQLELITEIDGQEYSFDTNLFGYHNMENVVAAIATGLYFGLVPERMQRAVESYMPDNNRSQIFRTGKNVLICDSYNANPVSMNRAIGSFVDYPSEKKTVILGDMLELGGYEQEEHEMLLKKLADNKDINVILVGRVFHSLAHKYNMLSFESREELIRYLIANPLRDSLVLIKASRALGLEKIYGLM